MSTRSSASSAHTDSTAVETAPSGEHREPREQPPFVVEQQVVAPVDDGAQGLVARQRRAAPTGEHTEPVVEQTDELVQRQYPESGRRQLQRERQMIEPAAQLGDDRLRVGVDRERGAHRRAAIGEQLDGGVDVEPTDREQRLAGHPERLTAGGDHHQIRDLAEQRLDDGRGLGDDVLAVVEHDHLRATAQVADQQPDDRRRRTSTASAPAEPTAPSVAAIAPATASGSRTAASSTSQAPSRYSGCRVAAVSTARRVLPAPPGPINVTSRRVLVTSTSRARSSSRPTNVVRRRAQIADRPGRDSRATILGRRVEGRILGEHPRLELLQARARIEAELFDQRRTSLAERPQRIGLAAGAVQRQHQQLPQPLPQRVALAQRLQLPRHIAMAAQRQIGLDPGLDRGQRQLVQPRPLTERELGVGELDQRLVATQRERGVQRPRRRRRIAGHELAASLGDETLEADDVEIVGRDRERVAGIGRHDLRRTERPPQLRHRRLERVGRIARRRVAPQVGDEAFGAHRLAAVQRQDRNERAQLHPADRHRRPVVGHGLELAEQTHLHRAHRTHHPKTPFCLLQTQRRAI